MPKYSSEKLINRGEVVELIKGNDERITGRFAAIGRDAKEPPPFLREGI